MIAIKLIEFVHVFGHVSTCIPYEAKCPDRISASSVRFQH